MDLFSPMGVAVRLRGWHDTARNDVRRAALFDEVAEIRGATAHRPRKRLATAVDQKNGSFGRRGRPVRTSGAFLGARITDATLADVGTGRGIEGARNKRARPGASALASLAARRPARTPQAPVQKGNFAAAVRDDYTTDAH